MITSLKQGAPAAGVFDDVELADNSGERASTGISGFDEVLCGGLVRGGAYLLSASPGLGKTTFCWHFLTHGAALGESVLFITFGESERILRRNAARSGFDLAGVTILDLSPSPEHFRRDQNYDLFSAAEVERDPTTHAILEVVERIAPRRVVVDSITSLRYLAADALTYRRESLAFVRYLVADNAVVLMTSESTKETPDDDVRFLSDGVIELEPWLRANSLRVTKFRGSNFKVGRHAFRIDARGATVYPRLVPEEFRADYPAESLPSGLPGLDRMLSGGIERGTITLLTGPSGVGKTTVGVQFMKEAAGRGDRSTVYTFDEDASTLLKRCQSINIPVRQMIERGTLSVVEIDALRYGPDEFANMVRDDVEKHGTRLVMIDSVSAYRLSVAGDDLTERLHSLSKYLTNVGVTVLLVSEVRGLADSRISDVGISYLADNVIFMRYFEKRVHGAGEMSRCIGILKKRLSDFEKTVREFSLTPYGIAIGEPIAHVGSILGQQAAERGDDSDLS